MTELSRRYLLAGAGTGIAAALAGCSTEEGDESGSGTGEGDEEGDADDPETGTETAGEDGDGSEDDSSDSGGTLLGDIRVENVNDRSHAVDVVVEFDDEIEHWTTHELEAGGGTTLDRDWTTEPGSFRVTARLDGADPVQVEPDTWNRPDCLELVVLVDRDAELTMLADTEGGRCGDGSGSGDGSQPFDGD